MLNTGGSFSRWVKKQLVQMAESANALNLDDAADILNADLQRFMIDLRKPEHELRVLVSEMLYKLAADLWDRVEIRATVESWKNEVLEKVSLLPSIRALLGNFRNLLVSETEEAGNNADYAVLVKMGTHSYLPFSKSDSLSDLPPPNVTSGYI